MIRIAIINHHTHQPDSSKSSFHHNDFVATTELDPFSLSAWLEKQRVDILILPLPNENESSTTDSISKSLIEIINDKQIEHWRLNTSRQELIPPNDNPIPLTHNECCILRAAANATGNLISRKILIEALGQNFLFYDERRLESLVSRLRRKLASYSSNDFPIKGVKGQGYLLGIKLQKVVD